MNFDSSTGYKVSLSKLFNQPVYKIKYYFQNDGLDYLILASFISSWIPRDKFPMKSCRMLERIRITLQSNKNP